MLILHWFSPVHKVLLLVLVLMSHWFSLLVHKVLMLVLMFLLHWFSLVHKVIMLVLPLLVKISLYNFLACMYSQFIIAIELLCRSQS